METSGVGLCVASRKRLLHVARCATDEATLGGGLIIVLVSLIVIIISITIMILCVTRITSINTINSIPTSRWS